MFAKIKCPSIWTAILGLIFLPASLFSQTTLAPGDVAIIAYTADDANSGTTQDDEFTFVLLRDVEAGTQIHFTDFGWTDDNKFQSPNSCGPSTGAVSDGAVTWTATSATSCGTQVKIQCKWLHTASVGSLSVLQATYNNSAYWMNFATGGDQVFAFQGSLASPTLLAGLNMDGLWVLSLGNCDFTSGRSVRPAALASVGQNLAIDPEVDNAAYDCSLTSAEGSLILASINNVSNWSKDNTSGFNQPPCPSMSCGAVAPSITSQPENSEICMGENASFSITAEDASSYQWQINTGGGFVNISDNPIFSGAQTTTLTITAAGVEYDNIKFRCIASGLTEPAATSNEATLTVNPRPIITQSPGDTTVCDGSAVQFNVVANDAVSYQWMANAGLGFQALSDAGIFSGTKTATLNLSEVSSLVNNYLFRCEVTGVCTPNAISGEARLTIDSAPEAPGTIQGPENVCEEVEYTWSVAAVDGADSYLWTNDENWPMTGDSTNEVSSTVTEGNTTFRVVAKNACGSSEPSIKSVYIGVVDTNVSHLSGGDSIGLRADLDGAKYQWLDCQNNWAVLDGDTSQTFIVDRQGIFAVEITTEECKDTSACFSFLHVGLADMGGGISVYPNPAQDYINVDLAKVKGIAEARIYTLEGRLVKSQRFTNQVSLQGLAKGTYLLQVVSEERTGVVKVRKE